MKTRTREIAKVGIFGSIDNPTIVTEKDLKEIAETFLEIKKAPVQFGHWGDAANPRLANVVAVKYDPVAKSLTADIDEDDTLSAAVDQGYYPDVSIGAKQRASDGKMYLHHLAYLGQEAPAVKDLIDSIKEPLGIAASDVADVKCLPTPTSRALVLSEPFNDKSIKGNEGTPPAASSGMSSLPPAGGKTSSPNPKEEPKVTEQEAADLEAENKKLKSDIEKKDVLLSDSEKRQKDTEREKLRTSMDGRVPKALQDRVIALADSFDNAKTIELSDGDAKRTVRPAEALAEIFAALPKLVEPGELNLSDGDPAASPAKPGAARAMMGHV
jgi:hypothetical protein